MGSLVEKFQSQPRRWPLLLLVSSLVPKPCTGESHVGGRPDLLDRLKAEPWILAAMRGECLSSSMHGEQVSLNTLCTLTVEAWHACVCQ